MLDKCEIRKICDMYGISIDEISDVIDSSRSDVDVRLAYIINKQFVLHCYTSECINETFVDDIDRLEKRYKQIGVWVPTLQVVKESNNYLSLIKVNNIQYRCFIEELAPFQFLDENKVDLYEFKLKMLPHLGKLANKYKNIDLSKTYSMWSIINLSPFDTQVDEKQENIDLLCSVLEDEDLVNSIKLLNDKARKNIEIYLDRLPKCVFQGDLNPSNILTDEDSNFKGIIDFNMFGTEVCINCFLNESMYYIEENDFNIYTIVELFDKITTEQNNLMKVILNEYKLNKEEILTYNDYKFIIFIGFYPNVMLWIDLVKKGKKDKVYKLLKLICNQYKSN